jgi:hypothetical protein
MNSRFRILIAASIVGACFAADAAVYTLSYNSGFANSGVIPDANPTGWSDSRTVSVADPVITDISVRLNVSGGFNGDLYAYISYNGVLVPLLNRVGIGSGNSFGYSDTGFNMTLSTAGAFNVHDYGAHSPSINGSGQLTGTWQADGRNIDPNSAPASFDAAGTAGLGDYSGLNPNGTWTLFFADLSGGAQSTVVSWGLDISAVPEPANVALGVFAGLFCAAGIWRVRRKQKQA